MLRAIHTSEGDIVKWYPDLDGFRFTLRAKFNRDVTDYLLLNRNGKVLLDFKILPDGARICEKTAVLGKNYLVLR